MERIRTLYIIGNGFDMHHKIPSSYYGYMRWLQANYLQLFQEIGGTFDGANEESWWADFESGLGNVECMYDISGNSYPDYDVEGIRLNGNNSPERLATLYKAIQRTFSIWVMGLNQSLPIVQPDMPITSDALYLTFNYTNTLEKVYNIPSEHILHIHGKADRGDDIIIGHNSDGSIYPFMQEQIVDFFASAYEVEAQISAFQKPTTKLIEKNYVFFESLSEVEHITVCGFSFSDVDMPYVKEILKHVHKDSVWNVYVHGDRDKAHLNAIQKVLKINMNYIEW